MSEVCTDNRFEIIAKAKADLLESTNIETSADEMVCLDSFLLRCWQMGWLKKYEEDQRWIPITTRPMDEWERKEWSKKIGYELEDDDAVIYTSQLPDDGQECIVCSKWGNVFIDTFSNDPDYGCYFEDHGDMDGLTAWMPFPKPWRGEGDE